MTAWGNGRFLPMRLAIELCPLPIFLIAYLVAPAPEDQKIFVATGAFIAAAVGATLAKLLMRRPVRPLSWASVALILLLGCLTLWLRDESFIKMKPTIYALAAVGMTGFALLTGRGWMQSQFDNDRHLADVDEDGRRKLACLMIAMSLVAAILNELVWRNMSTLFWIGCQIWGGVLLFFLFAVAGMPIMGRHWSGQCRVRPTE